MSIHLHGYVACSASKALLVCYTWHGRAAGLERHNALMTKDATTKRSKWVLPFRLNTEFDLPLRTFALQNRKRRSAAQLMPSYESSKIAVYIRTRACLCKLRSLHCGTALRYGSRRQSSRLHSPLQQLAALQNEVLSNSITAQYILLVYTS